MMVKIKLHQLSVSPDNLALIKSGNKSFELRKKDDNYEVGEIIVFFNDKDLIHYEITCILYDIEYFGLKKDYCILGFKSI